MTDINTTFSLAGKVALVSGAARGIGAEIAKTLAAAGANVMVTDVLEEPARQVVSAIRERGREAAFQKHDVTREDQWETAVQAAVERLGGLDVVVNNAGILRGALLAEMSVEAFRQIQEINVTGTFLGVKHGIRTMRPGGAVGRGGAIVNLSSAAGLVGFPTEGAYCASKGAVRLLTKAAAVECGKLGYGIRVNSVHPGLIKTELGNQLLENFVALGLAPDVATADAFVQSMHPIGIGQPRDIAHAVVFLASDAARWVTGAELVADGGATAA